MTSEYQIPHPDPPICQFHSSPSYRERVKSLHLYENMENPF